MVHGAASFPRQSTGIGPVAKCGKPQTDRRSHTVDASPRRTPVDGSPRFSEDLRFDETVREELGGNTKRKTTGQEAREDLEKPHEAGEADKFEMVLRVFFIPSITTFVSSFESGSPQVALEMICASSWRQRRRMPSSQPRWRRSSSRDGMRSGSKLSCRLIAEIDPGSRRKKGMF